MAGRRSSLEYIRELPSLVLNLITSPFKGSAPPTQPAPIPPLPSSRRASKDDSVDAKPALVQASRKRPRKATATKEPKAKKVAKVTDEVESEPRSRSSSTSSKDKKKAAPRKKGRRLSQTEELVANMFGGELETFNDRSQRPRRRTKNPEYADTTTTTTKKSKK